MLDLGLPHAAAGLYTCPCRPPRWRCSTPSCRCRWRNQDNDRDGFQLRFSLYKDAGVKFRAAPLRPVHSSQPRGADRLHRRPAHSPHRRRRDQPAGGRGQPAGRVSPGRHWRGPQPDADLEEKTYIRLAQPDSLIVLRLLAPYARWPPAGGNAHHVGAAADLADSIAGGDGPGLHQTPAERNGFVFFIKPTVPGSSLGYWGPPLRLGLPQPALTIDMGPATNVSGPPTMGSTPWARRRRR